jgi:hypothetical protein
MEVKVTPITDDSVVLNTARITVWKDAVDRQPSDKFMRDMYFKEHSPIRAKEFLVEIRGIPSYVSVHFVRHHTGFTPFVSTQRDDRRDNPIPRSEMPQGTLVDMDIVLNAQSFIDVSRKRLCGMASYETREAWKKVVEALRKVDPNLADCCVPNCVYRGGICPELRDGCGYNRTEAFEKELLNYMEGRF